MKVEQPNCSKYIKEENENIDSEEYSDFMHSDTQEN